MQVQKGKQYFKIRNFENLREMFLQSLELYKDNEAFVFRKTPKDEPESRTYSQFYDDTKYLGTKLLSMGYGGEKIAIIGDNSYEWCVAHFGIICGVGVSVPLDKLLPEEEILTLLERGEVKAVFYDSSFQKTMDKASSMYPQISKFIAMNKGEEEKLPEDEKFSLFSDLLEKGKAQLDSGDGTYVESPIDPDALMALLFTSGTTSQSKAVMLSHRNVTSDIKALAGVEYFEPGTRVLSVLPLHHTFENTCGFLGGLYFGFTICENDGLRYIQKNMQEYKINCIIGVPLLFQSFYTKIQDGIKKKGKEKTVAKVMKVSNALRKIGIDLRRKLFKDILINFGGEFKLGICGAAPIDPKVIEFFDGIGVKILEGYGLTETSPVAAGGNAKVFVPGSVGQPLTGVEIAIDSEDYGIEGEILVRGDIVMLGYYKNDEATKEVIDEDGWFHTGDIGKIDPKNKCIYITGRMKSMIVLKNGKKVFPEELEHLIGQFDFIKESMVWGEVQEGGDVDVWAKVVIDKEAMKASAENDADDASIKEKLDNLFKEVNKKMPSFKSVKYFLFGEDDMEKTTTKKIKRNIELDSIKQIIEKNKLKIKDVAGKNIDSFKKLISGEQKDSTKSDNKKNDDNSEG